MSEERRAPTTDWRGYRDDWAVPHAVAFAVARTRHVLERRWASVPTNIVVRHPRWSSDHVPQEGRAT